MLMVSLADILREQLRDAEAAALANEAGRLTGLSHQQETSVMIESAELARDMGLRGESIEMWNRIEEVALREHSARLEAVAAGGLGETWFTLGNLARAEPLLRRSLQLLRDDPSSAPSQLATALSLMARLYMDENKLALAGEAVDEAIEKDGVGLGIDHPQIATLLELKAAILSRRGEAEPAREDLERARGIMSAHFGPDSAAVAGVLAALGDVEERANRPGAAVAEYEKAVKLLRGSGPETLKLGTEIVTRYAAALKADHRPEEARAVLRNLQASRAPDRDPAPAENAAASQPAAAKSFR
jgi:tetratricopeptide (TPR) repeat protein